MVGGWEGSLLGSWYYQMVSRLPLYVLTCCRLDDFFGLRRKSTTLSTAVQHFGQNS